MKGWKNIDLLLPEVSSHWWHGIAGTKNAYKCHWIICLNACIECKPLKDYSNKTLQEEEVV